ncbi:cysteine proteinase [Ceratobasidium sp. AG-I]|nr:cysteine proteinase [Ceratobasidium sp. AG-I]
MADDIAQGDRISDAYVPSSSRKRAPPSVDRRGDPRFSTSIKSQSASRCGLCAPFSFTSAVEGTHKVWQNGYNYVSDLSPVWVGRCKGGQSCDAGRRGGTHGKLINAVRHEYIRAESCVPIGTVDNPNCDAPCSDRDLPYITESQKWEFRHQDDFTRNQFADQIREWISTTGPVMSSICQNSGFGDYATALKNSSSDIVFWSKDPRWGKMTCGTCDHAITVVGYNTYIRAGRSRLYWIIQNSYGSDFGRGGYQFIENGSAAMWTTTWYGVKVNEGRIRDGL